MTSVILFRNILCQHFRNQLFNKISYVLNSCFHRHWTQVVLYTNIWNYFVYYIECHLFAALNRLPIVHVVLHHVWGVSSTHVLVDFLPPHCHSRVLSNCLGWQQNYRSCLWPLQNSHASTGPDLQYIFSPNVNFVLNFTELGESMRLAVPMMLVPAWCSGCSKTTNKIIIN